MKWLLVALLAYLAHAGMVTSTTILSSPVVASTLRIDNDLGPTVIISEWDATSMTANLTLYAEDSAALGLLAGAQPTAFATAGGDASLTLVGRTSLSPQELGAPCALVTYSLQSPLPPCKQQTITFSTTAATPQPRGASLRVHVPPGTVVCVNGFCASALFNAVPPVSPTAFRDLGNGVIYDGLVGVMWHAAPLPTNFPYGNDNFGSINLAEKACAASTLGGFSDWRLPDRSEFHRMADHGAPELAPALNTTFFPVPDNDFYRKIGYWTNIRSKVSFVRPLAAPFL
jgi:hypothetical protein